MQFGLYKIQTQVYQFTNKCFNQWSKPEVVIDNSKSKCNVLITQHYLLNKTLEYKSNIYLLCYGLLQTHKKVRLFSLPQNPNDLEVFACQTSSLKVSHLPNWLIHPNIIVLLYLLIHLLKLLLLFVMFAAIPTVV